jgi:hypothetical protein
MESLNKAIAGTKKQWPIQDMLIDQISKIRGSGSGGNGGGNKNSHEGSGGGSEDESLTESLYEMVQVLLATIAFILMVTSDSCFVVVVLHSVNAVLLYSG